MRLQSIAFALLLLGASSAQAGLFDDAEARKQIADLKSLSDTRNDTQSRALLDLSGQIQTLREELAKVRGQLEAVTYELDLAKKRQQDLYLDADARLRKLEPPVAAAADGAKTAVAVDPALEGQEYEAALDLFKAAKYKEASAALTAFVTNRPDSKLTPGAQFWLGSALYSQRDCRRAIEVYSQLAVKWPDNPKAPEALLAMATCQQELGNAVAARRTLESLLAQYPDAPASDSARQRLKKR